MMAKATVKQKIESVTLELDGDEAQFIADVMFRVGGNLRSSRRRYAAELLDALRDAHVVGRASSNPG